MARGAARERPGSPGSTIARLIKKSPFRPPQVLVAEAEGPAAQTCKLCLLGQEVGAQFRPVRNSPKSRLAVSES